MDFVKKIVTHLTNQLFRIIINNFVTQVKQALIVLQIFVNLMRLCYEMK